jgi:hypothetical protein
MTEPSFEARMLAQFHRLVPEVTTILVRHGRAPAAFGIHAAQVDQETAAAMDRALAALAEFWPTLTGDLPPPPTVRTRWWQESGHTSAILAAVSARYDGVPSYRLDRLAAAERALAALGWTARRRDPRPPHYLRLTARQGRTMVEVSARARPGAYDVDVRHGPVLVGPFGADLLTAPARTVPFPRHR